METERRVTHLTEAVLTLDGNAVAFTLTGPAGPLVRLKQPLDDMADLIASICTMVKMLHPDERPAAAWPVIAASGVGLADSGDPTTTAFVLRLPGLDLAFAIPNTAIPALARGFAQKALALSAQGPAQ